MRLNARYQQYHEMLFYIREESGEQEFFYLHDRAKEEGHNTILALVEKGVRLPENTVIQMVLNRIQGRDSTRLRFTDHSEREWPSNIRGDKDVMRNVNAFFNTERITGTICYGPYALISAN